MAKEKKVKEKIYKYRVVIQCEKCKAVADIIGPCIECGNRTFVRIYVVDEIE